MMKNTQVTAYNSGSDEIETWLVIPISENIATKYLRINTSKVYFTHTNVSPFTVMISEDFNGINYDEASCLELNVQVATNNNSDWQWIDSEGFSLSEYSGNAAIAFIYKGSNTEDTSYKLDDVQLQKQ